MRVLEDSGLVCIGDVLKHESAESCADRLVVEQALAHNAANRHHVLRPG